MTYIPKPTRLMVKNHPWNLISLDTYLKLKSLITGLESLGAFKKKGRVGVS